MGPWMPLQTLRSYLSQARLSAAELLDHLFTQSEAFRRQVCSQAAELLHLCVGHDSARPLPPPVTAAEDLRRRSLEMLERWRDRFGDKVPQASGLGSVPS